MSHPSRVRGLKWYNRGQTRTGPGVAPFTGAWIEIDGVTGQDTPSPRLALTHHITIPLF